MTKKRQKRESREAPTDLLTFGLGPDGAPIEGAAPVSITLARIELTNGNQFEFVGVRSDNILGQTDELGVREIGGGLRDSAPTFPPFSKLSSLDMFLKLTPDDTPIPKMLAALDRNIIKKTGRQTTKFLGDPILVDLDERGLSSVETDSHYCAGGPNSFENDMCAGASVYSNTWWWCDPQAHYYFRDRWTTNNERRNSLGITAACGGGLAITTHYYKSMFGNWIQNHSWSLPSGYWHWTMWQGGSNQDRWIRHQSTPVGGNSYVRCVSFFWS